MWQNRIVGKMSYGTWHGAFKPWFSLSLPSSKFNGLETRLQLWFEKAQLDETVDPAQKRREVSNLLDDLREKWLEAEAAELDERDQSALLFDKRLEMLMVVAEQEKSDKSSYEIDDGLEKISMPNEN